MNITPALPNPHQASVGQDKGGVPAVKAVSRSRNSADQAPDRSQPPRIVDPAEREQLVAQVESRFYRRPDITPHSSRALASYAAVADGGERTGVRDLLGFDAYA